MSYKWVHFSEQDSISQLDFLRKKFNTPTKKYLFKDGKYKGNNCIFVLNDLTHKVYQDPVPSKQHKGDLFFAPLDELLLSDYEVTKEKREWKIKVDTVGGTTLWMIPASLEPKKIVFDFDDEGAMQENLPFSLATEYGTLAYSIFQEIEAKKNIELGDPRVKKLVMLGLQKSYNLPIDVINKLAVVSVQDLDPLLCACMGINDELMEKKSDG